MPKTNQIKKIFLQTLLITMVFTTLLFLPQRLLPATLAEPSYSLSVSPTRAQEGFDTNITLNITGLDASKTYTFNISVTSSANANFSLNLPIITDGTGSGSNKTNFWKDFPSPANTNRTGTYRIAVNETLATANFTVGLTDKTQYLRLETVSIRAAGYLANEPVIVDMVLGGTSVFTFPRSLNADSGGIVSHSWQVPSNASLGVYTVGVTNKTDGTKKDPLDIQTFTVEAPTCELQTINLAEQPLSNVTVKVYNATSGTFLKGQDTNETGWARFVLNAGNYTFKAYWRSVEVGVVTKNVSGSVPPFQLKVNLSHLKLTVKDETGTPIPWVDLNISYKPQTTPESGSFTTNLSGEVVLENTFTNIDYVVEARRYGFLFANTTIPDLPAQDWNNRTITAPTYTMVVKVLDSNDKNATDLKVSAYEWSSGTSEPAPFNVTDSNGNVTLRLTFGKYRLKLFKGNTFLNEVTVDLVTNPLYLVVRSNVYKCNLNVTVVDYFGQPIPNVSIEFRRKVDSNYEIVGTQTTGTDGVARFNDVIGGDSQITALFAGKQSETQYLYLVGPVQEVVFKMDAYVSILGYALETSQFVTVIVILLLVVAFLLALTYKKLPHLLRRPKK